MQNHTFRIPALGILFSLALFLSLNNEVTAQTCTACQEGQQQISVSGTQNLSTLIPGYASGVSNVCFTIQANSTLVIDMDVTIRSSTILQRNNGKVTVSAGKTLTFEAPQTCLTAIQATGGGIVLAAGTNTPFTGGKLVANALVIDAGAGMTNAITAQTNSSVDFNNAGTTIINVYRGIDCQSCSRVGMAGGSSMYFVTDGVFSDGGRPAIEITGGLIVANVKGVYCDFSGASLNTPSLNISDLTVDVGTNGSTWTGGGGIIVTSTLADGTIANPLIEGARVTMNGISTGINVGSLSGVRIEDCQVGIYHLSGIPTQICIALSNCSDSRIIGNVVTGLNAAQTYGTMGIGLAHSVGCSIFENVLNNVKIGVEITGDCNTPDGFSGNQFNGSQDIGLRLPSGSNSKLGEQYCQPNKWNGTFSDYGAYCDPTPGLYLESLFKVYGNAAPNMPPSVNISGWFEEDTNCPEYLIGGNQSANSAAQDANFSAYTYSSIRVYPNPATENFQVYLPQSNEGYNVELTDLAGKLVSKQSVSENTFEAIVETSTLLPGIYLVRVCSKNIHHVEKIIIFK